MGRQLSLFVLMGGCVGIVGGPVGGTAGGAVAGGAAGGAVAGGAVAGGAVAGGDAAGGAVAGGDAAGGAVAGGAVAGGAVAGGAVAGGAVAGGAVGGGAVAGGAVAGGDVAGGAVAGGTAGGLRDAGSSVDGGPRFDGGFFACPRALDAGPSLSVLAAQMQSGEWRPLASSGWTSELLYTDCNGNSGSTAHTDWSDELSWDQRSQSVIFLGAGHLRAFGFVFMTEQNNTWCRDDVNVHSCLRSTGYSRCFTHAYDHQAFDQARSELLLLTAGREVVRYSVETRAWSVDPLPTPIGPGYGQVLEVVSHRDALFHGVSTDGVFIARDGGVTTLPTMAGVGPYHNVGVYLPRDRAVLYGGGNGSKRLYLVNENSTVTQVPDIVFPAGVTDQIHTAYTTLTYDPARGDALLLSQEGTFHALDVPTRTWRRLPDPPWRGMPGYSHALATPIDDHQVVLFAFPQSAYRVWLYKP